VLEIEDGLRHKTQFHRAEAGDYSSRALMASPQPGKDGDEGEVAPKAGVKALSVTTNQALRISAGNGAKALVQFTQFGATNAHYRWR